MKELIELVEKRIPKDDVHGLGHVMRVLRLGRYIAVREGADIEVVEIAAILHDIARGEENHAVKGAEMARTILENLGYGKVEEVVHAIEAHSFSSGVEPKTLEAKVLSDADKIDALGYVGIYRVVCHGCSIGRSLEDTLRHFEEKLLRLPDLMYTTTGREMALERVKILRDFHDGIRRELNGWLESSGVRTWI